MSKLIPANPGFTALWFHPDEEAVNASPVIAWCLDSGSVEHAVALPGASKTVELADGTVIDFATRDLVWPTRSVWVEATRSGAIAAIRSERSIAEKVAQLDWAQVPLDARPSRAMAMLAKSGLPEGRAVILKRALDRRREQASVDGEPDTQIAPSVPGGEP